MKRRKTTAKSNQKIFVKSKYDTDKRKLEGYTAYHQYPDLWNRKSD